MANQMGFFCIPWRAELFVIDKSGNPFHSCILLLFVCCMLYSICIFYFSA